MKKRTGEVPEALGLEVIITRIKDHKNVFWYVSRTGTVKELTIYISTQSSQFCRFYNATVESKNLNNGKVSEDDWIGSEGTGWMFDHYYKYGHIFSDRSYAFSYLKERIEYNKKDLVKTAKLVYNSYPEYQV